MGNGVSVSQGLPSSAPSSLALPPIRDRPTKGGDSDDGKDLVERSTPTCSSWCLLLTITVEVEGGWLCPKCTSSGDSLSYAQAIQHCIEHHKGDLALLCSFSPVYLTATPPSPSPVSPRGGLEGGTLILCSEAHEPIVTIETSLVRYINTGFPSSFDLCDIDPWVHRFPHALHICVGDGEGGEFFVMLVLEDHHSLCGAMDFITSNMYQAPFCYSGPSLFQSMHGISPYNFQCWLSCYEGWQEAAQSAFFTTRDTWVVAMIYESFEDLSSSLSSLLPPLPSEEYPVLIKQRLKTLRVNNLAGTRSGFSSSKGLAFSESTVGREGKGSRGRGDSEKVRADRSGSTWSYGALEGKGKGQGKGRSQSPSPSSPLPLLLSSPSEGKEKEKGTKGGSSREYSAWIVNSPCEGGVRPVHFAAVADNYHAMQLMLVAGANPFLVDAAGSTCAHYAAKYGSLAVIKLLSLDNEDVFSMRDYCNNTPLHIAAAYGHTSIVQFLLSCAVDPSLKNSLDQTALKIATTTKQRAMSVLLQDYTRSYTPSTRGNPFNVSGLDNYYYCLPQATLEDTSTTGAVSQERIGEIWDAFFEAMMKTIWTNMNSSVPLSGHKYEVKGAKGSQGKRKNDTGDTQRGFLSTSNTNNSGSNEEWMTVFDYNACWWYYYNTLTAEVIWCEEFFAPPDEYGNRYSASAVSDWTTEYDDNAQWWYHYNRVTGDVQWVDEYYDPPSLFSAQGYETETPNYQAYYDEATCSWYYIDPITCISSWLL